MSDSDEKKRAIYFTDEEYSRAEELAKVFGTTAQELLTDILEGIINNLEKSEAARTKALESLRKFKLAGEGDPLPGDELY
jgi:predicted DNA-binding protein